MAKFIIKTLGCKVNQYESEAIGKELEASGWLAVQRQEPSDLCIINTCTVTQKAAMQSRQAVRQAIRANPGARIIVTGCYAQTEADELKKIEGVHDVIGHAGKHKIASTLQSPKGSEEDALFSICSDMQEVQHFEQFSKPVYGTRTRPFLKIQDGCSAFCTYCIVPLARGPSRSMSPIDALDHIKQLHANGYHEVVLCGVHLGNYGLDLSPKTSLSELLRQIDQLDLIERVRLSSIEPLELNEDIIERISNSRRFCRHFHIPLQSGDDQILKKMNRPYTSQYFHDLVVNITQRLPDAAIGVDIMAGFPGETAEAFESTYQLVQNLPIAYMHVFPFSSRPGTAASKFSNKIPPHVIKARCERIRNLGEERRLKFYHAFVGQTLDVLIEESRDSETRLLKGISSNYIPMFIDASDDHMNSIKQVKVEKLIQNKRLLASICPSCPVKASESI